MWIAGGGFRVVLIDDRYIAMYELMMERGEHLNIFGGMVMSQEVLGHIEKEKRQKWWRVEM